MDSQKFFYCKHCGNLVGLINNAGVPLNCCGEPMTELVANTADAAQEKHVPDVKAEGNIIKVQVGEIPHPMAQEHHIAWVYLQTDHGGQRKCIRVGGPPVTEFAVTENEKPLAVFAYCNLHSLWKKEL